MRIFLVLSFITITYVCASTSTPFVDVTQDPSIFPPNGYTHPPDPAFISSWFDLWANNTQVPRPPEDPLFFTGKNAANGFGNIGVAIFDFDGDGDPDVYVANSEGTANSLFKNLLTETGSLKFVDVAAQYGVDAVDLDSSGVCVADVDNDGDLDFVVLSNQKKPRLFKNNGVNSPFQMINSFFNTAPVGTRYEACSFGDVNGDGFHDLYIGTNGATYAFSACVNPFLWDDLKDELWINDGTGSSFTDETTARGLLADGSMITWAVAVVDIDQDGDLDIITANDMCATLGTIPFWGFPVVAQAASKVAVRIWINDGTGNFVEKSRDLGTNTPYLFEAWMGIAVGDLNSDGLLDLFVTNSGDVSHFQFGIDNFIGVVARSRHFLQQPNGTFIDAWPVFQQDPIGTEFGFGCSMTDIDASGTTDIVYLGGLCGFDSLFTANPGVIVRNDGKGNFIFDSGLATSGRDYQSQGIKGVAVGDLDKNGFPDIVALSAFTAVSPNPNDPSVGLEVRTYPQYNDFFPNANQTALNPLKYDPPLGNRPYGNRTVVNGKTFVTFLPDLFDRSTGILNRKRIEYGQLSIEINQNGLTSKNNWIGIGTIGTVPGTPRDGIGSTIRVWKCALKSSKSSSSSESSHGIDDKDCLKCTRLEDTSQMIPIMGGSSASSTDSFVKSFGLGKKECASIEVWYSSTKKTNSFVSAGKKFVTLPQLDCDVKDGSLSKKQFKKCVRNEVKRLVNGGYLSATMGNVVKKGMLDGYQRYNPSSSASGIAVSGALARSGERVEHILLGVGCALFVSGLLCIVLVVLKRRCLVKKVSRDVAHLAKDVELEGSINSADGDNV